MTSLTTLETTRLEAADVLAALIQRRVELLPAADDAEVLSELTTIERRITAAKTGACAYDLAA